jgi:hypothetical protein
MAVTFSVSLTDANSAALDLHGAIAANALAAARYLGSALLGNASIEIEVRIEQMNHAATGTSLMPVYLRNTGGFAVFEQGFASEVRSGLDPNASAPDVVVRLDPDFLRQADLWLDPNPGAPNTVVPSGMIDAYSIFLHEFLHAVAFNGWRDWTTAALPGNQMSTYDASVQMLGGNPYFVGTTAQNAYGQPVPLTPGNLMHYGNSAGGAMDLVAAGVMNNGTTNRGQRYGLTVLDLAILDDAEVPLAVAFGTNAGEAIALTSKTGAFGLGGADTLTGSSADNFLNGGPDNDLIAGAGGRDLMVGGSGADGFVFDATALTDAQAAIPVFDLIRDFNRGNGGGYNTAEGDRFDLSALLAPAYNLGAGAPVGALVRVMAGGGDADLQVDPDGTANGMRWTTIAHLDGVLPGYFLNVLVDPAAPAGSFIKALPQPVPASSSFALAAFGTSTAAGGWDGANQFPRALADVNGDGLTDIVAFGHAGVTVAMATGGGHFATPFLSLDAFGAANFGGGWASQDQFPRQLADVNGDGMADIVGFGYAGASVALATGGGHDAAPVLPLDAFGAANFGGGWASADLFPRKLADVNGDGMADIIGFGYAGANVALATGGGHFAAPFLSLGAFGAANFGGGWASADQFPRALADVNHDGMADIVGFGIAGASEALATGGGHFAAPFLALSEFGAAAGAGGWSSQNAFPRLLGDFDADGTADIAGFGIAGVTVARAFLLA